MKKILIFTLLNLYLIQGYSQYESIEFETDSTKIELVRNSLYRIWEESYKLKDSVFYSVRYIKDTTQINLQGWKRKNGQYFGEWSEYKIDGTWLYTIDYSNHNWTYNEEEFKFQALKDSMKAKADEILIHKFGKEFFDNNLEFNFDGHTYIAKWKTYETGTFWVHEYLGSWTEPINERPNSYIIAYSIKLGENEFYNDMLAIKLDSTGNLIDEQSKFEINLEKIVIPRKGKFTITREKAIQISRANKLKEANTENYETTLRLGWGNSTEYPGEFYYEVAQQYGESTIGDCKPNCIVTKFFNIWRYNPWTSELIFKQPMKKITKWSQGCGESGDYTELNK